MSAANNHHCTMASHSPWAEGWRRLKQNKLAVIGLCVVAFMVCACYLGPLFLSYDYQTQKLDLGASGPSWDHWLGTDTLGRDQLARILYGGRVSLGVGLMATAVSLLIGVVYGAISGFLGGRVDSVMMRFVDILFALPFIVFVILLMVLTEELGKQLGFGPSWNLIVMFCAIGAVEWLTMARIVRGQVMAIRRLEYVEAAASLGLTNWQIIRRHILPNALGPIIVYATLTVPAVMLLEAMLSFLGLGIQAPMSSWGLLISEGRNYMAIHPWLLIFPALFFSITLLSLNFLGDGLRDALDVKAGKD